MYANPIYRWRESMAIALSRLQATPLKGYVSYRSISDHLAQHGLGLMAGEATPLPTWKELTDLVSDRARMEKLLKEASQVPVDHGLPHVTLAGSEKGLADYYYWAFRLFGLNLPALAKFYYVILIASVILFFVTFRASPFAMFLLMLYLIAHVYMVDYANMPFIHTIHNSRFFPVLSVLPALHLLLLLVRGERPAFSTVAMAALQVFIFSFLLFCRVEAVWEGVAIITTTLLVVRYRPLCNALWHRSQASAAWKGAMAATWPAMLVSAGLLGVAVYSKVALDRRYYATETRTHAFWHPLFAGMVGASPQLARMFPDESGDYSDNVVYLAVLADLRARNEAPPEIAFRQDGMIYINAMRNMGVYDQLVKRVFFNVVKDHPWLALKSFLYDKPRDQILIFDNAKTMSIRRWLLIAPLTLGATLVAMYAGLGLPHRHEVRQAWPVLVVIAACSWLPTLIVPSALIVDVILFYLMVALLYLAYLHIAAWRHLRRTPQRV